MRQQEYFNALEIAETAKRIGTNSVPHTKQKVLDLAVREGWNTSKLARYRQGRGGGMHGLSPTGTPHTLTLPVALATEKGLV